MEPKVISGFSDLPLWVKKGLAVGALTCLLASGIVAHLVGIYSTVKWGDIGDMSGWASTLVSIFGFVMIFYQLRKNHEDFQQTAKIALFEKRYEAFKDILAFERLITDRLNTITFEEMQPFAYGFLKASYLFPDIPNIQESINEVLNIAHTLHDTRSQQNPEQSKLKQEFTDKCKALTDQFTCDLTITLKSKL